MHTFLCRKGIENGYIGKKVDIESKKSYDMLNQGEVQLDGVGDDLSDCLNFFCKKNGKFYSNTSICFKSDWKRNMA